MASLRPYPFVLAAGESRNFDAAGKVFAVRDSLAPFLVSFDGNAEIPAERGDKYLFEFGRFTLRNPNAASNTLTLLVGDGDLADSRPQSKPQVASRTATIWNGAIAATATPWALVELANTNRVEIVVVADATNTGYVKLFSQQNVATSGFGKVYPGQTFRINYTGDVYIGTNVAASAAEVYASYYV